MIDPNVSKLEKILFYPIINYFLIKLATCPWQVFLWCAASDKYGGVYKLTYDFLNFSTYQVYFLVHSE